MELNINFSMLCILYSGILMQEKFATETILLSEETYATIVLSEETHATIILMYCIHNEIYICMIIMYMYPQMYSFSF